TGIYRRASSLTPPLMCPTCSTLLFLLGFASHSSPIRYFYSTTQMFVGNQPALPTTRLLVFSLIFTTACCSAASAYLFIATTFIHFLVATAPSQRRVILLQPFI